MPILFKDLIAAKGVSATSLSKISGVPKTTVMSLSRGERSFKNITVENAIRITKALGSSVEEIYDAINGGNQSDE
jgi:plasmid maintenance system antidote protein VapI